MLFAEYQVNIEFCMPVIFILCNHSKTLDAWNTNRNTQSLTILNRTGSESSTAKRSAIGASVTGSRRWPLYKLMTRVTLMNPHCSMAMSAKKRSKPVKVTEKFSSGTNYPKQTNKNRSNIMKGIKDPTLHSVNDIKFHRFNLKTWPTPCFQQTRWL